MAFPGYSDIPLKFGEARLQVLSGKTADYSLVIDACHVAYMPSRSDSTPGSCRLGNKYTTLAIAFRHGYH